MLSRTARSLIVTSALVGVQSIYLRPTTPPPVAPTVNQPMIDHRTALVRRRVELNRIIKRATLCKNAVPIFATKRDWAARWRRSHQNQYDRAIREAKRELAQIEKRIGPPPEFWCPRKLVGAGRIARQYDPAATRQFWQSVACGANPADSLTGRPLQGWAANWIAEQHRREIERAEAARVAENNRRETMRESYIRSHGIASGAPVLAHVGRRVSNMGAV